MRYPLQQFIEVVFAKRGFGSFQPIVIEHESFDQILPQKFALHNVHFSQFLALCVCFFRRRNDAHGFIANAGKTLFGSVGQVSETDASRLLSLWADSHDFACSNWRLAMKTTTLRILLAWLDVLVDQVHAFHDDHLFFVVN